MRLMQSGAADASQIEAIDRGRPNDPAACRGGLLPLNGVALWKLKESVMKAMRKFCVKLVRDENGGEVLEYALIAGLIVVAAIAAITAVGGKVLARWSSVQNSM
jgi:pilus assembly protein Flp/PilA